MENFGELMQRLLEFQSGGRERSRKLIAEDNQLMDRLEQRSLTGKLPRFRTGRSLLSSLFWLICFSFCAVIVSSATDVTTYHNDIARTGQNLQETILTYNNVTSSSFGKLFTFPVDGIIDAQPLYLSAVSIPGKGTHNVVYAVTDNDSVYAFDADAGTPLWQVSKLGAGESPSDDHGCGQITPQIGITSTPVIDRTSGPNGTVYVVAMSKNSSSYFQRIHALDMTSGAEEFGGPVAIAAKYRTKSCCYCRDHGSVCGTTALVTQ